MDIDKFSGGHCDFCNYEKSEPCLSCQKIMYYEAIKDAWSRYLETKYSYEERGDAIEKLTNKIEYLGEMINELGMEIFKIRMAINEK